MNLSVRVALFASLLAVAAIGVVARLEYSYNTQEMLHMLGDHITDVAVAGAFDIPGDMHTQVTEVSQSTGPAYRLVYGRLVALRDLTTLSLLRFFTVVPEGDELRVVVSLPPGPPVGTRRPMPEGLAPVLASEQAAHLHRNAPGAGPAVTAYAPIKTPSGQVVGLLVVEATPKVVSEYRRGTLQRFLWFAFLGVTFAATLSLVFVRTLLGPVRMLLRGARRLREGDYQTPIDCRGAGDIGALARTMEEMRQALRARIQEMANLNLDLARRVQASIIPRPQKSEWMEVAVAYRPLAEVGGDYAHIHFPAPEILYVSVGDVTGHGVPAALLVNRAHGLVDQLTRQQLSPDEMLRRLNSAVLTTFQQETMFMSFLCTNINLRHRQVLFSNAGHPPAFLFRPGSASVTGEKLQSQCTLLGIDEELVCDVDTLGVADLRVGDRLVLYTDGLIEASPAPRRAFGEEGVVTVVQEHFDLPAQQLAEKLIAEAEAFADGRLDDDVLVLIIQINRTAETAPEEAPPVGAS